ncbi:gliding motility-associated peptidyl-prolyl isomerase GldI [Psychroserpens ponticola]|uniref:Peptidyl-prolyl cis-trans isomerase n=1 Tax=Psychroserpens ponticola TaxID=2932268 RepID=A0ABY7RUD8_9FLAO|nr:gliding motility-associated peptidyl-prolyl isomerase GldI [Psychroserpens ponticola]WCO00730.1 gliding motility-associated peptidyl-prolyl isomerase GldI [Psychroserpens ponticola]
MKPIVILLIISLIFSCKSPDARRPESVQSGSFYEVSAERNIKLNKKEQALIQKIIDRNPDQEYIASKSGFWYFYNSKIELDTITPQFGDIVNFKYNIKDLNENTIYSEDDIRTQNYVMDKEELFTGLREGLKLMKPGEVVTFLFPSQKAYGYYGDTNRIGTNIPLICKVTVNTIKQNQ